MKIWKSLGWAWNCIVCNIKCSINFNLPVIDFIAVVEWLKHSLGTRSTSWKWHRRSISNPKKYPIHIRILGHHLLNAIKRHCISSSSSLRYFHWISRFVPFLQHKPLLKPYSSKVFHSKNCNHCSKYKWNLCAKLWLKVFMPCFVVFWWSHPSKTGVHFCLFVYKLKSNKMKICNL